MQSRSSALDFQDGGEDNSLLKQHPDLPDGAVRPVHLDRNKSERQRTQGLQRAISKKVPHAPPVQPRTLQQKWEHHMINDGGRLMFLGVWVFLHLLVAGLGFVNYQIKDNVEGARRMFGVTYAIARTAALVLHVDAIFILLPVCRNFISLLRRTPLNDIIPFDKSITFHKATGWSIVAFTGIHIVAHMVNFARLAMSDKTASTGAKIRAFALANFATGPGITGWIMTATLFVMVFFSLEKRRQKNYETFWYSHHLFIIFFVGWQLHGMWCMIKPDRPPYCSSNTIGVFWRYWLVGGSIWIVERILREVRSRHRTYISKVIQHPSNVMELHIKKDKTTIRAGQYIYLSCPEVSYFQWHPFTLTSAPEEDYLSVHIRVVGDFTSALAKAVGCTFPEQGGSASEAKDRTVIASETKSRTVSVLPGGRVMSTVLQLPMNRVLPRVMVDGPFGSASEDFLKFETVLLIGAGIGVTPFASILKSIWYRMNNFNNSKPTRLSKVYFTWVIRDFGSAEWFHSLLHAIEEQDHHHRIEINIYLTANVNVNDIHNIVVHDVGAEKDAITSLRAPTQFGRPNWDRVFGGVAERHPNTDAGVFFCGPPALSKQLHLMANKYTDPQGTRFFFRKENF